MSVISAEYVNSNSLFILGGADFVTSVSGVSGWLAQPHNNISVSKKVASRLNAREGRPLDQGCQESVQVKPWKEKRGGN
jgi:hypothetical protein